MFIDNLTFTANGKGNACMHFSMLYTLYVFSAALRFLPLVINCGMWLVFFSGNKFMLTCSAWVSVGQAPRTVTYSAFPHQHVGT